MSAPRSVRFSLPNARETVVAIHVKCAHDPHLAHVFSPHGAFVRDHVRTCDAEGACDHVVPASRVCTCDGQRRS